MTPDLLECAITLRKQGKTDESRALLFSMLDSAQMKGSVYLNIAWSYDNDGKEEDALEYYILSLNEPLSETDKFEATFGLACTLRCLGELQKAESVFQQLRKDYPAASEVIPFYALCLSSLGRKDDAIRLLFDLILENPPTGAIASYQKTLLAYVNADDTPTD